MGSAARPIRAHVLVVDDDESMCDLLDAELTARGFRTFLETDPERALQSLRSPESDVDAVVTDLKMRSISGVELCERIAADRPDLPVILLTAHGTFDSAVAALRVHAHDFLTKPADVDELAAALDRAVQHRRLVADVDGLHEAVTSQVQTFPGILGSSPAMRELIQLVGRVSAVDAAVLIRGESGTGKELVAHALHERSRRRDGPFVALNCAAIPQTMLEAELFGHVRGAFTDARADHAGLFERADGGTIFLDEIAELHPSLQPKLLRALQERTIRRVGSDREVAVDVRLITATNIDLAQAVDRREFRADLFYRLNVIEIVVPPLRDREGDVLLLAQYFLEQCARTMGRDVVGLSPPCAAQLAAYAWPGNVRELANVIERAVALTRSRYLGVGDLPEPLRERGGSSTTVRSSDSEELLPLDEVERRYIRRVMEATRGNKTLAAKILGVDRRTLYRKDWAEKPEETKRPS